MTASIDLSTTYVEFQLRHPFMVGGSPRFETVITGDRETPRHRGVPSGEAANCGISLVACPR
jgi:hypothetical protein